MAQQQIQTIKKLENLTGTKIPEKQKKEIQKILSIYPVKFSSHLSSLIKKSEAVRKQFLPNILELEEYGTIAPFEEGLHLSEESHIYGLERIYNDRAIVTLNFVCPAYCRFCFRKSRVLRNRPSTTKKDIDKAVEFFKKENEIRGVLITGGDPFLSLNLLFYLIEKLSQINHIQFIRIGTRSFLTQPENLNENLAKKLSKFIKPNLSSPEKSKTLIIVTHFNHPDEISSESVRAFKRFTKQGIIIRNQSVLLKDINDSSIILKKLFEILLANNVIPYYLFHCMPLQGIRYLRSTVQKGIDIMQELSKFSGLISPHYIVVTQVGKIRLIHSSKLKYKKDGTMKYVILQSPYKTKEFLNNTKQKELPKNCFSDKDGFIIVKYLDGDD